MNKSKNTRGGGRFRKGVSAFILNKKNELLLVKKASFKNPGDWGLPGGGIENNESPKDALFRELYEELGTDNFKVLEESSVIDEYIWPKYMIEKKFKKEGVRFAGQSKNQYILTYTGNPEEISIAEDEITEIAWVPLSKLKSYLIFDGQYENARSVFLESLHTKDKLLEAEAASA